MATEAGANRNVIVEFDRIWQQSISNTVKYCRGFKKDHPWKGCLIDAASSPKQIRSYLNRALIPNRSEYWLLRTPSYPIFSRIIFCSLEQALQGAPPILQEATANKWLIQLVLEKAKEPEIKLPTSAGSLKKQEKFRQNLFLLYWLCQRLWLCGLQKTVENSQRNGHTGPPDLPLEKLVCKSGSNS